MGTGAVGASTPGGSGTDPTSSAAGGSTAGGALGQTAFLQLLVAEMQDQDPLNPMDSTSFVTQLAQFQMLSDLNQIETDLNDLAGTGSAGTGSAAAGSAATAGETPAAGTGGSGSGGSGT